MIGRRGAWLLVTLLTASACAGREPASVLKQFDIGLHRLQASTPLEWEFLDQGAQKRFRKGESEIVLLSLGPATRTDLDQLADWGLAALTPRNDDRRQIKSKQKVMVDNREAVDVETWNRLDHTWPQRLLFVPDGDYLVVLHTPRLADAETVKAFEAIRASLHFAESARR